VGSTVSASTVPVDTCQLPKASTSPKVGDRTSKNLATSHDHSFELPFAPNGKFLDIFQWKGRTTCGVNVELLPKPCTCRLWTVPLNDLDDRE